MFKKAAAAVLSAAMLAGSVTVPAKADAAAFSANYAEALQKSLYFYECQQAGPLPDWNRVEWRADSTMTDEVLGGWYDAGDHVKFNLPMGYSASLLAWGLYQYPDGIEKCGEMENYVNNLEFVLDYLAACDQGDEIVYQVGIGQKDHTWWGPVEMLQNGVEDSGGTYADFRAALKSSEGCSAVFGEMAAALAAGSAALKGRVDQSKLDNYLKHAKHIFEVACTNPSDEVYNNSDASGFYRSSHFYDELLYAANWLYIATEDETYLDKAKELIKHLGNENGTSELVYKWSHCWDDTSQGGILLYAINSKDEFYIERVKKHLDYLLNECPKVNDKLLYVHTWGCARYAETSAFITAVACDTVLKGGSNSAYEQLYEDQVNYVLGDNPTGQSFVVGYGDKPAHNAHHRTAHGSWKNDLYFPLDNRHVLYGALVGGPNQDGSYIDDRNNYINNEVATDYNAGYTAALCKMIDKYGGETDPNFPPVEAHDGPEFFTEVSVKGDDDSGTSLSFKITNHSAWPARIQDNISFRYYMDLTEVVEHGYDPTQVVVRCDRDQAGSMYGKDGVAAAVISPVTPYTKAGKNIYYIEVTLPDGRAVMPVSEGRQQCEIMIALVCPEYQRFWDASNDPSHAELVDEAGNPKTVTTTYLSSSSPDTEPVEKTVISGVKAIYTPTYINGELYYGTEPDGTTADGMGDAPQTEPKVTTTKAPVTTAPTTTTAVTPTGKDDILWGDANDDGKVDLQDAVAILQYVALPKKYPLTEKGKKQADVDGKEGISGIDALSIQKYDAKLITKLPEK